MPIRSDTTGTEKRYLLDMVDVEHGHTLEIGCGDGRLTRQYISEAQKIIAIDVQIDDLQTMQESFSTQLEDKLTILMGSAIRLPFANNTFDHVIFAWSF